jgi:hypothetical protein
MLPKLNYQIESLNPPHKNVALSGGGARAQDERRLFYALRGQRTPAGAGL